jgi:AraC-like DNA-binding protein
MQHLLKSPELTATRDLKTLVENRTTYSHNNFELNVFETHFRAEHVELQFNEFVLTSMFRGKKVMHLKGHDPFEYVPGETVVLSPGEKMVIDFPEARKGNPTQCLAIEISKDLINQTVNLLNENFTMPDACGEWALNTNIFHLLNCDNLANVLNRVTSLTINENDRAKGILLDLAMKEIMVRLMQTQAKSLFVGNYATMASNNPMAAVVNHISNNLSQKVCMDDLAKVAYMSRAKFFTKFKEIFGETPAKFIANLRINKAKELLQNGRFSIAEVAFQSGFENISHFVTSFKKEVGTTPGAYKKSAVN